MKVESSFNEIDWKDLDKEDLIINLKNALDKIDAFDKTEKLLKRTEKHRISLLNEVEDLKKEMGRLLTVKSLMDNAGVYGYSDLLAHGSVGDKK